MNHIEQFNNLRSEAYVDPHLPESRLRYRFSSILQLSQEFSQATNEDEIITLLLRFVLNQTEALGVSFIPTDDHISTQFVIRSERELENPELKPWEEYLDAQSIRSQCRICRKAYLVSEVCPLLSNPFSEKTKLFCTHLRVGKQKLGVVSLFFKNEIEVDSETQDFVHAIGNTAALAITSLRYFIYKSDKSLFIGLPSTPESQNSTDIQNKAILEERSRLAREIHDGLAQILSYVKLQLSQSLMLMKAGSPEDLINLIQSSYQAISDAYIDAREAIDDLHHLSVGVDFAWWLRQSIYEFGDNYDIETEIIGLPDKLVYPPHLQLHLTRMVQETLSNIRKHAGAAKLLLEYKGDEQYTTLSFHDDGIGLDAHQVANRSQHGIRSLRERADIIDAELTITGQPGKGTTVQIRIPNKRIRDTV